MTVASRFMLRLLIVVALTAGVLETCLERWNREDNAHIDEYEN